MGLFDRFDICEAHYALEADFNVGGILRERPSNQRRNASTGVQLARMKFSLGLAGGSFDSLSENGKEIYLEKVMQWGLPIDDALNKALREHFIWSYLQHKRPEVFGVAQGLVEHVCQSCGFRSEYAWGECEKCGSGLESPRSKPASN